MLKISGGIARFEGLSLPHGFSTMPLGNMAYSWGEEAEVNRNAEAFYTETGLSRKNSVHMLPQHGSEVVLVDNNRAGQVIKCDALIARSSGLTLSVLPADCLPIIIKSTYEDSSFVALVHAGWKGTRDSVVMDAVTVILLVGLVSSREDLMAYVGPGIGPCCYRPSILAKVWGATTDLLAENVLQLLECGVKDENIVIANTCTFCSVDEDEKELFSSHQRSKRTKEQEGRFIAAVAYR